MFRRLLEKLSKIFRYSKAAEYPRRYLVVNAFDGAITVWGIILGVHFLGGGSAAQVVGAGVGASLAMGISGASGTYMAEMAEQERRIKELEDAMLTKIEATEIGRAHKQAAIIAAAVNSLSAALAGLLVLSPYAAALVHLIPEELAFTFSLAFTFATLFTLGVFLGRVAGKRLLFSGLKAVTIGAITLLALILLDVLT